MTLICLTTNSWIIFWVWKTLTFVVVSLKILYCSWNKLRSWRNRIRSLAYGCCALHGLLESWCQPFFRFIANRCFFPNMFVWVLWGRSFSKQTTFRKLLHVWHTRRHYGLSETFVDIWTSKCSIPRWNSFLSMLQLL